MKLTHLFALVAAGLIIFGSETANAGETIEDVGTLACATDKWDEKEPEKGHKLVDASMRCFSIPNDHAAPKSAADCIGKYEYMPDGSWKGSGTCSYAFKGGDTLKASWEEGSHLKEYTYKNTGGTGKYEGASGDGTYMYENVTDTMAAGTFKGTIILP